MGHLKNKDTILIKCKVYWSNWQLDNRKDGLIEEKERLRILDLGQVEVEILVLSISLHLES